MQHFSKQLIPSPLLNTCLVAAPGSSGFFVCFMKHNLRKAGIDKRGRENICRKGPKGHPMGRRPRGRDKRKTLFFL